MSFVIDIPQPVELAIQLPSPMVETITVCLVILIENKAI